MTTADDATQMTDRTATTRPAAPLRVALVGVGWRAQFYLRVAAALPRLFQVTAVATRGDGNRAMLDRSFGVPAVERVADLLAGGLADLVVSCAPWARAADVIRSCVAAGMPVLSETPPADTLEALLRLWDDVGPDARVAVAEEYPWRPQIHAALRIARSGRLGRVHHVRAAVGYRYHGVAVIRHALGVGRGPVDVTSHALDATIVEPPGRDGPAGRDAVVDDQTIVALLDLGERRSALFDFSESQYFSPIRHTRLTIRGSHGEVDGTTVRWATDVRTAFQADLRRDQAGVGDDLRGAHLVGIHLGAEEVWRNHYAPARLSDDEIAVAAVLQGTGDAFRAGGGGADLPYSLADGCHDHDLGMLLETAGRQQPGRTLTTPSRPWHD